VRVLLEVLLGAAVLMDSDPPSGGVSPLAWAIIGALVAALSAVVPALWVRGNKISDRMYADLKECNEKKAEQEEEVLGLLKVLRVQMEDSKEGRKR
jgi:hypothetical protein